MLLPSKILRLFVCLCFLSVAAPTAFSQGNSKVKEGYENYVNGLFRAYDTNEDGSLDEEEVDQMRRKPVDADANLDGEISKAELLDIYLAKAGLKKKSAQEDSSSEPNAETEMQALTGPVKIIVDDETGRIELGGNKKDIAVVEARMKELNSKAAKANERSVRLNIWIVNGAGYGFDELKGQSRESVMNTMKKLAADSAVSVEQFQHDAMIGRSFTLTRQGQVPVVMGVQRRGDTMMSQTSNFDVGTNLTAKATRRDNDIVIDFQVEKSIVEDSDVVLVKEDDDEPVYAKSIQQFSMEAEVECEIGSVSVVSSTEGDRTWALVFCVTNANSDSKSAGGSSESSRKRASRRPRDRDRESRNRSRRTRD